MTEVSSNLSIVIAIYLCVGALLCYKVAREACHIGCHEAYSGIMGGLTIFGWPVLYPLWLFWERKEAKKTIQAKN